MSKLTPEQRRLATERARQRYHAAKDGVQLPDRRKTQHSPQTLARAAELADRFVAEIVPAIRSHCVNEFRCYKGDWHEREDRIAEAIAAGWFQFLTLIQRGSDPFRCKGSIAMFAMMRSRGRQWIAGAESIRDVLSWRCRRKYHFRVRHATVVQLDDWLDGPLVAA
jgi:hypothetical protein